MTTKIDDFIKKVKSTAEEDFFTPRTFYHLSSSMFHEMCELLKEQETADTGSCRVFQCKKCGYGIDDIFVNDEEKYQINPRYCPYCGRKVKWDG